MGVDFYLLPLPKKRPLQVGIEDWLLNGNVNWLRVPMYASIAERLRPLDIKDKRAIEIGGSEGTLRELIEGLGAKVEVAANYPALDVEDLPYDGCFDVVVLDQVLEHVKHPWLVPASVARALKPGGICIATSVFVYPGHKGANYDDYYRFSPKGFATLFEEGFEILSADGWGNAETMRLVYDHSEKGPEGSPIMSKQAVKERGLYAYTDDTNYIMTWCIAKKR